MTIDEIIEGCRIGGLSLEQRLAAVEYSSIPRAIEETRLTRACLLNRARKNEVAEIAARLGVPRPRAVIMALGFWVLATAAHAEPKTITVENCAKVEVELYNIVGASGGSVFTRVICTGPETIEPKVVPQPSLNKFFIQNDKMCLDCGTWGK